MRNSAGRIVGVVLYGIVAGFAAATLASLGPILFAALFAWIFASMGWKQALGLATGVISLYVFIVGLGLIIGVTVCIRVWITRLRNTPRPLAMKK